MFCVWCTSISFSNKSQLYYHHLLNNLPFLSYYISSTSSFHFFFLKKEGDRRVREGDVTREGQRKRREILSERFQDTPVLVLKIEEGIQE